MLCINHFAVQQREGYIDESTQQLKGRTKNHNDQEFNVHFFKHLQKIDMNHF